MTPRPGTDSPEPQTPAAHSPATGAPATWSTVLFDMDGTIVDSVECIGGALELMAEDLGLPAPDLSDVTTFMGPPMHDTVERITGFTDPRQIDRASARYRAHHDELEYLVSVYPGMVELIGELHEAGIAVGVATSKRARIARRWLTDYHLGEDVDVIAGASEDQAGADKAGIIASALDQLAELGADTSRTVMVGDRRHDIEGAASHALETIYVEWGYGTEAEAASAAYRVKSAAELAALLMG